MDKTAKNKPGRSEPALGEPEHGESAYSELTHPHDLLVRNILGDADIAADLLRNYLDPALECVDMSALEAIF